ncbi:MAG: hypothetical protein M1823_007750, partial [Watsoniomyces obsoletus]
GYGEHNGQVLLMSRHAPSTPYTEACFRDGRKAGVGNLNNGLLWISSLQDTTVLWRDRRLSGQVRQLDIYLVFKMHIDAMKDLILNSSHPLLRHVCDSAQKVVADKMVRRRRQQGGPPVDLENRHVHRPVLSHRVLGE